MASTTVPELTDIKLNEKLSSGSSGIVFKAKSKSMGRVAAKTLHFLLHPERFNLPANGENYLQEESLFFEEVRTLMGFSHPNIIKCYGVWYRTKKCRQILHLITELGESFQKFLLENKISEGQAVKFAIQIAEGIKYLHENLAAHRDLKPDNMVLIKVENEYRVKLIDFGQCKLGNSLMKSAAGTRVYADPQMGVGKYDNSVDIYSFGCILIHLFCGYESLCKWKISTESKYELPEEIKKELREPLAELVNACISKDKRLNATTLVGKLEAILKNTSFSSLQPDESGDKNARKNFHLALKYYYGDGVEKNLKKAVECYTLAASQGLSNAQHNLGLCYYKGEGVAKDLGKAVEWFILAANQGHPTAQFKLGRCYYLGEGVAKDLKKAVELYTLAANHHNSYSLYTLGLCYDKGEGVEVDLKKAVELYTLAANHGNSFAQCTLGYCYEKGKGVTKNLKKAVELYTLAANQGLPKAQYFLANKYYFGDGVEKNLKKAVELYRSANLANSKFRLPQALFLPQ